MRRHILLCLLSIVIILVLSSFVSADLSTDIWGAWTFNEDIGYNPNTGGFIWTNDGSTNVSGISGTGLHFDRDVATQHLTSTNSTLPSGAFTINIWYNSSFKGAETFETILSKLGITPNKGLHFLLHTTGTPYALFMDFSSDGTNVNQDNLGDLQEDVWYMITFRFDGSQVDRFINGTRVDSDNSAVNAGTANWELGADAGITTFDGLIDEITIWNKNISDTEIRTLFNGTDESRFHPFVAIPDAPSTPTYQFPTPGDNSVDNANRTINCTTTDSTTNLRFYLNVSLVGGNTDMPYLFNVTATDEGHRTFLTNFSDGVYTYDCFIQNITNGLFSNEVSRTLTIDTVTPTITLNPNNAFNTSNISSHNQYLGFMFFNITFDDETGLFGVVINVTLNGVSEFNHTNTSLNNEKSHNFTRNVSTASWGDGVYDIEVTVADGSTVNAIDDYDISGFLSRITFDTQEGNKIDIIGSGAISTIYNKEKDRYEFGFNYLTKETTRKYTIKCDNELFYMNNPKKIGHFVCWSSSEKNGNWIDFKGLGNDFTVKKIKEKEYDITFTNLPSSNQVWVKSIGGLNILTENYQWFKGSTTNIFLATATSGFEQEFKLNITLDFDLVKNITAQFSYNKTFRTVTRTDFVSSILFDSTFIVPDVNQTLNLSWIFNVTQRNNAAYAFSVNSTQELVSPQVNLSVLDEENQTLIKEDLTIFFTGPTNVQTNTSSGTLNIGNLELGEYFIQAESGNYPRRGVFLTVTNASVKLNLFLVKDITGNSFIDYIVQDDGRNRLDNVRMTFQKSINNSFVTVAQVETDFAGQARIFQDQQNEYRIVLSLIGFETQTIDLIPLLTSYTLTLSTLAEQLFETTYEGIRYTISPAARVLNASGKFRDISFTIFDGTSSLEFFGLQVINHSYTCIPADCLTNITGSPAGGTATVQVNLSEPGSFDTLYFFKRNGFPLQFINGQRSSVRFLIGDRLADNFQVIGENLGTPVMRSIFAAILITVLTVLASQMGVVGLGLMLVISFGTIFFMLLGFIPRMVAMITLFFGIAIYFVLGKEA